MSERVHREDNSGTIVSTRAEVTPGLSIDVLVNRLLGPGETVSGAGSRRPVLKDGAKVGTIVVTD